MTYEAAVKELQEIMDALQQEAVSIDDLSSKVSRAAELIQLCKNKLRQTEEKIEELFNEE